MASPFGHLSDRARRHLAVLSAALVALALPGADSADAAPPKCGNYGVTTDQAAEPDGTLRPRFTMQQIDGAGVRNITAEVSSCKTARRIVLITSRAKRNPCTRYDASGLPVGSRNPCQVVGFTCRTGQSGYESSVTRCTRRGGRIVRYESGS